VCSSPNEERPKSRVALFSVGSAQPTKSLSLPFGFRNIAWYPFVAASSFSLVGVTHDWKVVVLGENIHLAKEEGAVSRELASHAAPQRRTLFQDIFGKSAFGEQTNAAQPAPASSSRPWTGREGAGAFEDPAYLLPPLETLFEPLMSGFLKLRVVEPSAPPLTVAENEDVDMDGQGHTTVTGADRKRMLAEGEIEAMVDLFRKQTLKGT
jgi:NET1-associated nuclear protein 1 (U3 small nucleolar RNA-associated protein 17)